MQRFQFRARAGRPALGESDEFARRLSRAIRVAAGLGLRVELVWGSGIDGPATLAAHDALGSAWVSRTLDAAYQFGHWVPCLHPEKNPSEPRSQRFGVSLGGDRLPFPVRDEDSGWCETALSGLAAIPAGGGVRWRLEPMRLPDRSPDAETATPTLVPVREGFHALPPSGPERSVRDRSVDRLRQSCWGAQVVAWTPAGHATSNLDSMVRLVETSSRHPGGNGLRFVRPVRWIRPVPVPFRLSEPEVVALFPNPWSEVAGRGTDSAGSPAGVIRLGGSTPSGICIPVEPGQGRHLLVLGETGMGKSSLLVRWSLAATRHGSVILFDPIGDTARRFLERLGVREQERTVWVSPERAPVGINALAPLRTSEGEGTGGSERARDDLVGALRRVRSARYAESSFWGPRVEEMTALALTAAARYPEGTLLEAVRLLDASAGPMGPVPAGARGAVEELRGRVRERPEEVDGARRVLAEVTRSSILRTMLCCPAPRWSVREAVAENRILALSGDAPSVGETVARSLLSVYLALVWAETLARPRPAKLFLVLDEAQWYAHESLGEILRLGRRANLHVTVATQSLRNLPEALRETLLTNCSDLALFRGSPDDAREIARWSGALRPERLNSLPRGRAAVLIGKGRSLNWLDTGPLPSLAGGADRLAELAAGSAELSTRSEPSSGVGAAPVAGASPAESVTRRVLLTIWAGLLTEETDERLRVGLASLRAATDPDGAAVREAGRRLRDAGVLEKAGKDPGGSFWLVRRDGFAQVLGESVGPEELKAATERWREVARSSRTSSEA